MKKVSPVSFISTKELSKRWGIDPSLVIRLARNGRIEGAAHMGNGWMFPHDAEKPADGRRTSVKTKKENDTFFRFPIYVNFEEGAFFPPLSDDEKQLRKAQLDFYACNFNDAKKTLLSLLKTTSNRYIRICALFFLCNTAMYGNDLDFNTHFTTLNDELSADFPYKKEMMLLRYMIDINSARYQSMMVDFVVDPNYSYHPSVYYIILSISIIPIEGGDISLLSQLRYDTYEIACQQMEHDGYFIEAQHLHYLLLIVYHFQNNQERMAFHIRRGLQIAKEHEFYWLAAVYEYYYSEVTDEILKEFPPDFTDMIRKLGRKLFEWRTKFEQSQSNQLFLTLLSSKDFEYAFLATQGYSNRHVAEKLGVSEKTVSKRYNEIYDKLGITSKKELADLINKAHTADTL